MTFDGAVSVEKVRHPCAASFRRSNSVSGFVGDAMANMGALLSIITGTVVYYRDGCFLISGLRARLKERKRGRILLVPAVDLIRMR
jgi:hypothetical protein